MQLSVKLHFYVSANSCICETNKTNDQYVSHVCVMFKELPCCAWWENRTLWKGVGDLLSLWVNQFYFMSCYKNATASQFSVLKLSRATLKNYLRKKRMNSMPVGMENKNFWFPVMRICQAFYTGFGSFRPALHCMAANIQGLLVSNYLKSQYSVRHMLDFLGQLHPWQWSMLIFSSWFRSHAGIIDLFNPRYHDKYLYVCSMHSYYVCTYVFICSFIHLYIYVRLFVCSIALYTSWATFI